MILSTSKGITGIDFPANEDSQRPGFDGKLHAQESHPWIPLGDSYWEMGVNKNPKTKLVSDVEKSANKLNPAQRKESVLVFVTPRRLKSVPKNLDTRKSKYGWKDIRVIDASALEQWIECSIEAQVWLLPQLKRDTAGIETLRSRLNHWLEPAKMQSLAPVLFEELVGELSDTFRKRFIRNEKNLCSIAVDSEGEASAFLFYTLVRLHGNEDYQADFATKEILFFSTPESVKAIPMRPNNIIAVTSDEAVKKKLLEHPNARFIWIETTDYKRSSCDIALHPISRNSLFKAARNAGKSLSEFLSWENVSCGSITALHRFLSKSDSSLYPAWTKNETDIRSLVPLLFAGAWETSELYSDKNTVRELNADGATERSLEKRLSHFLNLENSPLWKESTSCGVKSKRDLFHICKPWILRSDCERFFSVVKKALITSPENPNSFTIVPNNKKCLSALLRKNLADTLVLLARNAQSIQACEPFEIEKEVARTVTDILRHWGKDTFSAYDDCLESFALAAPRSFLDFWEDQPKLCQWMMRPVTNLFLEKSPRPAFLAALKILCWEEATFERTVRLLARLAETEPQDNLGSKPSITLQWIFSAFFVHTGGSTQMRIEHLKQLTEIYPDTFWGICHSDLVSQPHSAPWSPPPAEIRFQSYRCCTSSKDMKAMLKAKENLLFSKKFEWTDSRINDLFDIFENISPQNRKTVIAIAEKWSRNTATDAERESLREHIDRRIEHAFKRAGSNISLTEIGQLKELCITLTAKTKEGKLLFLFSSEAFHQAYRKNRDFRQVQKRLDKQREKTLNQWKDAYGVEGLLQLMAQPNVNVTRCMASYCSNFLSDEQMATLICEALKAKMEHPRLRKMLIGLLSTPREKVLELLRQNLSKQAMTDVLKSIPPSCETARFVCETRPNDERNYWKSLDTTDLLCHNHDDAVLVAEKLLSVDRANAAFAFTWPEHDAFSPVLLFKLLWDIGNGPDTDNHSFFVNLSYEVQKALQTVSTSTDIKTRDKALLEIKFSPLLVPTGCSEEPPLRNLVDYIWQEPGFLVNLVCLAHQQDASEKIEEINSLDKNQLQAIVHTLIVLNFDNQSVASEPQKKPDYRQWTEKYITIAEQCGIRSMAEYHLGEILGRHNRRCIGDNPDKKTLWFNPDYCEVLEAIGTDDLLHGFYVGLYNSIGVHTRTLNGDTERSLVKKFREEAEKTKDYPKVQRVFRTLQNEFEKNAEHEDENLRKMQRTRLLTF